jgi:hypothetical protein
MADRPKQAKLFSFATGQPIDDPPEILEALDLLSQMAGRAMETGADPSELVSPDHNLLLCCDALVMLSRQRAAVQERWRALPIGDPERDRLDAECDLMKRPIYKLLLRISKLEAQTGPEGPSVRKRTLASCTQCSGRGPSGRELSIQFGFKGSAWPRWFVLHAM